MNHKVFRKHIQVMVNMVIGLIYLVGNEFLCLITSFYVKFSISLKSCFDFRFFWVLMACYDLAEYVFALCGL